MKLDLKNNYLYQHLNTSILLMFVVIAVSVKIIGDSLFYLFGDIYSTTAVTWKIVVSLFIVISLIFYVIKKIELTFENEYKIKEKRYFRELVVIITLTILLMIFNGLLPDSIANYDKVPSYFYLILIEFTSLYSMFAGFYIFYFLYKWLWIRRHKRTKLYLTILTISFLILLIFEIPFHYYRVSAEQLSGIPVVIVFSILVIFMLLFTIFSTTKRNSWIAVLPKKQKLYLLLLYFIAFVLVIIFLSVSIDNSGEGKFTVAVQFFFGSDTIVFLSLYCLLPYFFRLMFSTIASLPTTGIVERTTSELNSLTYLNRIVAKSIDINELIETLTELSLYTCRGVASWTELYGNNGDVKISALQFLEEKHINELNKTYNIHDYFKTINKPLLIQSIYGESNISKANWSVLPMVKSMIVVPLFAGLEKIGTLIILHPEEYGLEIGDLRVMEAFGDNINVALENAKLLKDSIEKERIEKELKLARDMQERLLPKELPKIKNYSISAFSIPAKEVGGDYYDVIKLDNGKSCVLIGDVAGKGMTAAFYMAQLKGVALATSINSSTAKGILKQINATLYNKIEKKMYITLTSLIIEDSKINIARAGHTPIIIKRQNETLMLKPKGLGIALANQNVFNDNLDEEIIELEAGDIILLFTDGISELRNEENIEFGYKNLKQIVETSVYKLGAEEIANNLRNSINEFKNTVNAFDDMTAVILVYQGN